MTTGGIAKAIDASLDDVASSCQRLVDAGELVAMSDGSWSAE